MGVRVSETWGALVCLVMLTSRDGGGEKEGSLRVRQKGGWRWVCVAGWQDGGETGRGRAKAGKV